MIPFGFFLIAVGAILRYATNFSVQNVDMDTVGLILMITGVALALIGILQQILSAEKDRPQVVEPPRAPVQQPPQAYPPQQPYQPPPEQPPPDQPRY